MAFDTSLVPMHAHAQVLKLELPKAVGRITHKWSNALGKDVREESSKPFHWD
jgi:hypothetical protein